MRNRTCPPRHPRGTRAALTLSLLCLLAAAIGLGQPGAAQLPVDGQTQNAIVDSVSAALKKTYVFPDVAEKMAVLLRDNLKGGKYRQIGKLVEFTDRLTADLQSVSHDKHLRVMIRPPQGEGESNLTPQERRARAIAESEKQNYGFRKVEILPGNIGYIDFRNFYETSIGDAATTAVAAMKFIAHTDAVIFDLRQNGGGSPSMIQLIMSYFFDEPVHLNSFYVRAADRTDQFWTSGHVDGAKMLDVPVYVLTSSGTFSGAEEFSYNFKNLKRGTIVGEVTGGGAHPVDFVEFPSLNVAASVPFGRAINPVTKTNWEGTGVEPDIKVPASEALTTARIEALKKTRDNQKDQAEKDRITWLLQGLEMEKNPVTLDQNALRAFEGTYGPRKIFLENGALTYQREGRPKFRLIPMGGDTFMLEGMDEFRVKFNRGSDGKVTELVGMYSDNRTDVTPKTQ